MLISKLKKPISKNKYQTGGEVEIGGDKDKKAATYQDSLKVYNDSQAILERTMKDKNYSFQKDINQSQFSPDIIKSHQAMGSTNIPESLKVFKGPDGAEMNISMYKKPVGPPTSSALPIDSRILMERTSGIINKLQAPAPANNSIDIPKKKSIQYGDDGQPTYSVYEGKDVSGNPKYTNVTKDEYYNKYKDVFDSSAKTKSSW